MRALSNALHQLKLWNVKMQNWSLLTVPPPVMDNSILVEMKLPKSLPQCM